MSAIEKELVKATGVKADEFKNRAEFLAALLKATGKLADDAWEGLSAEAQAWYNENADARNKAKKADKDIPDCAEFPDFKKEDDKPRRRRADDDGDDDAPRGGDATGGPDLLKKGQMVEIENKRGKFFKGEVVELDKECVVVKDEGGEETEIDLDRIVKVIVKGKEEKATGRKKDDDGDDEGVDPLKKGAKVKVTSKRGKVVEGAIVSIDDEELVVKDDDGEEHEFQRSRVESIEPLGGKKASGKKDEGGKKGKDADEGEGKAKRTTSADNGGVSVTMRIKQIIADNVGIEKKDEMETAVAKVLKKEGLECKDNTLALNVAEGIKWLAVFREKKLLKG